LLKRHGSSQKIPPPSGRNAFESNGTSTAPILLSGIQVAVHTTHEQLSTPRANSFGLDAKSHELIVGHDTEGRAEK
jgi:hypothetical protein